MPKVSNLFTDYNGTLEPRYLEISLAHEILDYHKKQGNISRYLNLLIPKQIKMCMGFKAGDKHKLMKSYVNDVLRGEDKTIIESAAERAAQRKTKVPTLMKKLLGEKRIFGRSDPKVKELFRKAKESGMTTGIYTGALLDLIIPNLEEECLFYYFDHLMGNKILYNNSAVSGLEENVFNGKKGLSEYLLSIDLKPKDTAFIDNEDIEPLTQVGIGIAAPTSKTRFRDECRERQIYTPNSWEEIAEILEI